MEQRQLLLRQPLFIPSRAVASSLADRAAASSLADREVVASEVVPSLVTATADTTVARGCHK